MRVPLLIPAVLCGLLAAAPARAGSLATFLAEVEDAGRAAGAARADLRIQMRTPGTAERQLAGVAIYRDGAVYVEIQHPDARVVVTANGSVRLLSAAEGEPARTGLAYDPIGDTPIIVDDFRPFRVATLSVPQITSETTRTLLVSAAPAEPSPYVLLALLLDREKLRARRAQYYERTIGNLVRMREDSDFVSVAGAWRPGRSEITDYRTRASATLAYEWKADPEIPATLFDPAAPPPAPLVGTP